MQWYYVDGESRIGPIDDNEFKGLVTTKKITSDTLVWHEGMPEWQEYGKLSRDDYDDMPEPVQGQACSQCRNLFPEEDLIRYDNFLVCAACKPAFFQKIKEGATVTSAEPSDRYGSIEKGINGQYDFTASEILKEAWELTKGIKRYIISATVCMYIIMFGLMFVTEMLTQSVGPDNWGLMIGIQIMHQFIWMIISYPITAGIMMIAIRHSVGLPISFSMVFSYFSRIIPLIITSILQMIFIVVGFLLLIIPGIYLSLAYFFAIPLIVEKNLGPWQALETSRKAVTHRWFGILGLFILTGLIMLASAIPLGIGLIWTLPMATVAYAVLYRTIFGVEALRTE